MRRSDRFLGEAKARQLGPGRGKVTGRPRCGRGRKNWGGDPQDPGLASDSFSSVKVVLVSGYNSQEMEVCHDIRHRHLDMPLWYTKACIPENIANLLFTFS